MIGVEMFQEVINGFANENICLMGRIMELKQRAERAEERADKKEDTRRMFFESPVASTEPSQKRARNLNSELEEAKKLE